MLIDRSIHEIRRLSHALVTPAIADDGLKESLLSLVEIFQELKTFDIHTCFDFAEEQVEADLKLTVYRILQESFSNTAKYAKASLVSIIIRQQDQALQVQYADNGSGFDPATAKQGIGLKNISSRAEAHQGKVQLLTSPGHGFALHAVFPLNER